MARPASTLGPAKRQLIAEAEKDTNVLSGVTISTLAAMFRMDRRSVVDKIAGIKPCGERRGAKIYRIYDVAPVLVRPEGDFEATIRRMRPNDIPPLVQKEYWNGLNARAKFLENEGQLWRTDKVFEAISTVLKFVRMQLLLMPDTIEKMTVLSDRQRAELQGLIDKTLSTLREQILKEFEGNVTVEPGSQLSEEERREAEEASRDDTFDFDLSQAQDFGDIFDVPDDFGDDEDL